MDGEALLRTIIARPADDAPRLIYADWLDERGQHARAEFVRLQCEWWQLQAAEGNRRATQLDALGRRNGHRNAGTIRMDKIRDRCRQLESIHGRGWFDGCPASLVRYAFVRGFLRFVSLPAAGWIARGPILVRLHPLERVALSDKRPEAVGVGGTPAWERAGSQVRTFAGLPPAYRTRAMAAVLPGPIYDRLGGSAAWFSEEVTAYPTAEDAGDALSVACLAWAKATEPTSPESPQRFLPTALPIAERLDDE